MSVIEQSREAVDRFVDALWIEDGLARNSLEAYRRDLTLYASWLAAEKQRSLNESSESDLREYMQARHAGSKATSSTSLSRSIAPEPRVILRTVEPAKLLACQSVEKRCTRWKALAMTSFMILSVNPISVKNTNWRRMTEPT